MVEVLVWHFRDGFTEGVGGGDSGLSIPYQIVPLKNISPSGMKVRSLVGSDLTLKETGTRIKFPKIYFV